MNLRNVAFEMPMRSSRTDSHVASIRLRLDKIREQVGFCSRSAASRSDIASQHESDDAHTQSARPSEQVDSTANLTCLSTEGTRVHTDGGQLRMKLLANSCSDRYLATVLVDGTCCNPGRGSDNVTYSFYANSHRFRAVVARNSRCSPFRSWFHRTLRPETLGSLYGHPQQSKIENRKSAI